MSATPLFRPFKRILVANRGEIALRIIRAARELNLESVAVYSDADAQSLHVRAADFAVRLPGITSAETYLAIPRLVDALKASGADAVHPGYGFLSESAAFAEAVASAQAVFIGPSPRAIHLMGDKVEARRIMQEHHLPIVPGSKEPLTSLSELESLAADIGFPVIIKAAAGGGGRGMRVVRERRELGDAFTACQREAQAYFGNPAVFCERYVDRPRHIEFQVLFDAHGHGVHLFERDCSIQRRHQKLLEEAPSAYLSPKDRERLGGIAVEAARAVGYVGAGTVEFICESPERAYFMEMNTRIQVEHPVTEMVTGIDLIAAQIHVAMGEPLGLKQEDIKLHGWAIETRINAEDPGRDFLPTPGLVKRLRLPSGPFVRVDSHLYQGYEIPAVYDSMVAKLITWGKDRPAALSRMRRALSELEVEGVPTTARFHEAVLKHPDFAAANFSTGFIETHHAALNAAMATTPSDSEAMGALLAALLVQTANEAPVTTPEASGLWRERGRLEALRRS